MAKQRKVCIKVSIKYGSVIRGECNPWRMWSVANVIRAEFSSKLSSVLEIVLNKYYYDYCYYSLTPRCTVLLEKLTGLQLVKKFPTFHGTRRFITALTSVRHLSLSWASPIQSTCPHPTSWRSILILSTHLRLGFPSGLFPSGFPTKTLYKLNIHYTLYFYSSSGGNIVLSVYYYLL